jgi:hypothetical protein
MLNHAGFDLDLCKDLWTEAAATATKLDNILVYPGKGESAYVKFYNKKPKYVDHLHTFGEVGVTSKIERKMQTKVDDWGRVCVLLGYADKHAANIFRFFHLKTKAIVLL